MLLGPRVHIRTPDDAQWRSAFPEGIGASAFSAPAFQRLSHQLEPEWALRMLVVDDLEQHLPVLGRRDRFGRWQLRVVPTGYDVMPIERAKLRQAELDRWMRALCTPRITHFIWWLPSWHVEGLRIESQRHLTSSVEVGHHETYVIRLDGTAEAHLERAVSSTMRRYVRRNDKAGVTIVARPDAAQVDAYVEIYERSFRENGWVGEPFPRHFFHVVANEFGRGGELAVVMHEGRVIGGGVLMYDHASMHYFQGAIDRTVKDVNPHVALYWYALQTAEARGLAHVDLGGINDGNEGLARFKTSWGAAATPSPMLTFRSGARVALDGARERFPSLPWGRLRREPVP